MPIHYPPEHLALLEKHRGTIKETQALVRELFKDDAGSPLELTPTQAFIFALVAKRGRLDGEEYTRVLNICHTRFGKSLVVALATLFRVSTFPEKWAIVSHTRDKAQIIMNYLIGHIFDNEYTAAKFRLDPGESQEAIRRHRNKAHLTFVVSRRYNKELLGEVYIATAKNALGFGAANVIEDEAAIIEDDEQAMVTRMLGDNAQDNFLMKIGNPFQRNHFYRSSLDPKYLKVIANDTVGLLEGRLTEELLQENRSFRSYTQLYACEFPAASEIDEKGWSYLLSEDDLKKALARDVEPYGKPQLGVDIARGGRNYNVIVLRRANTAKVLHRWWDDDLMAVVGKIAEEMKNHNVADSDVWIDDTGVGGGVTDRLTELGHKVNGLKVGSQAVENKQYVNLRAELYAGKEGLANWLKREGHLEPSEFWEELLRVRYKHTSGSKVLLESKDDMRKRGEESPDVSDALSLTFSEKRSPKGFNPDVGGVAWEYFQ